MRNSKFKISAILIVTLLSLHSAWADTSPSPAPSVLSDDYDTVCDNVAQGSQKAAYCAAAKDAKNSAKSNDMLWKIYAGVAGICTPMCVMSFTSAALPSWSSYVCSGASMGAGVADGVMTKNYMSAAMSVGTSALGVAFNQGWLGSVGPLQSPQDAAKAAAGATSSGSNAANSGSAASAAASGTTCQASSATNEVSRGMADAKSVTDPGSAGAQGTQAAGGAGAQATSTDPNLAANQAAGKAACLTAAMAGYNVYQKIQAKQQAEQTEKQNLEAAQQLTTSSPVFGTITPSSVNYPNPGGSETGGSTSSGTATQLASGSGSSGASTNPCNGASSTGAAISCASTADSTLAKQLSDPNFDKAFQASSGIPFGDFLNSAGGMGPSNAMGAAMGGALSPAGLNTMTGALADMQKGTPDFNSDPGGTYVGGGGGARGGSGDDVASVVGGIMSQFGKKNDAKTGDPVSEVKFSGPANRTLASATAEDTTVSLFDRVTRRYWNVTPRMTFDGRTLKDWAASQQASTPSQTTRR